MNHEKKIILTCTPLRFYTTLDEDLCFEWIKKISCIDSFKGKGPALYLHITNKPVSNTDLLNLIGLFDRYKFDNTQLLIFKNDSNKEWFD
jgi:hypothetical protein